MLDLGGLVSRNTASNFDTSTGPGRSSQQPSTSFGSSLSETKLPPIHTLFTPASARFRIALLSPLNNLSRFALQANLTRISRKVALWTPGGRLPFASKSGIAVTGTTVPVDHGCITQTTHSGLVVTGRSRAGKDNRQEDNDIIVLLGKFFVVSRDVGILFPVG